MKTHILADRDVRAVLFGCTLLFACACGKAPSGALNDTSTAAMGQAENGDDDSMIARLRAQMTDITPAPPGADAIGDGDPITPDIAWDPTRFNPKRMICISSMTTTELVGYADVDAVRAALGGGLEPVDQDFGLGRHGVPTIISANESVGWVGCTCPPKFEEFGIAVVVKDDGSTRNEQGVSANTVHVAFIYLATNHIKRQETMVHKFGVPEQFVGLPEDPSGESHIGVLRSGDHATGIYLENQAGEVVFSARRRFGKIPEPKFALPLSDGIFHVPGGVYALDGDPRYDLFHLDAMDLASGFFRIQDRDHLIGFDASKTPPLTALFLPLADEWSAKESDPVGQILKGVRFSPVAWTSELTMQGMAWAP